MIILKNIYFDPIRNKLQENEEKKQEKYEETQ